MVIHSSHSAPPPSTTCVCMPHIRQLPTSLCHQNSISHNASILIFLSLSALSSYLFGEVYVLIVSSSSEQQQLAVSIDGSRGQHPELCGATGKHGDAGLRMADDLLHPRPRVVLQDIEQGQHGEQGRCHHRSFFRNRRGIHARIDTLLNLSLNLINWFE